MKNKLGKWAVALLLATSTQIAFIGPAQSKPESLSQLEKQRVNFRHAKTKTARTNAPNKIALNKVAPNFSYTGLDGKTRQFRSFRGNPVLVMLADTTCPCVKAYKGRVKSLNQRYAKRGLRIMYLYPQSYETRDQIAQSVKLNGYNWNIALDPKQKLFRLFGGRCSSEVYLFDKKGVLRYHGALDDSAFNEASIAKKHVEKALLSVLAGKKVATPEVDAVGCEIPRL